MPAVARCHSVLRLGSPIVPVMKSDGRVRICGDYKVTVNRAAKLDKYPIPRIEELFASLVGGKAFTKLDLSHAYLRSRWIWRPTAM